MATNVFDTSKNTINVTSVTDENVHGFDDSKNKIDVTGNLITEIVPTVGQTYWVDDIECVCFYSNPASGDKLRVYSKNGEIHIVEAIKVSSVSVFKFIDKNHDLVYYTYGKDYVDTLPLLKTLVIKSEPDSDTFTFDNGLIYGYMNVRATQTYIFPLQPNAKECSDYMIERLDNPSEPAYSYTIAHILKGFRNSHSNVWCIPYDTDFDMINHSWISNTSENNYYLTSNFSYLKGSLSILMFKGMVYDMSQSSAIQINKMSSVYYDFAEFCVRLSAEF